MAEEDEQVGHLSDVLYLLPSCFIAASRLSEENGVQVTTRVAAEEDLASSELWGQRFPGNRGQEAYAVPASQDMELF